MTSEDLVLLVDTIQGMINAASSFCSELEYTIEQANVLSESGAEISAEQKSTLILGKNTLKSKKEYIRKLNRVLNELYTIQDRTMDKKGNLTVEDFI